MKYKIDESDKVILEALQQDSTSSLEALSEISGLSIPTVQRRLKRLRDTSIIEREIAVIDPDKVGQSMTFIVMVEMERERIDQLDAFRRHVRSDGQVQQCYYVTGEADFCLICTARDMADFEALTQRLFFDNNNVRRFRTSVVMDRSKVGLTVNIGS